MGTGILNFSQGGGLLGYPDWVWQQGAYAPDQGIPLADSGGMFGGMQSWAPGERPMAMGAAPDQGAYQNLPMPQPRPPEAQQAYERSLVSPGMELPPNAQPTAGMATPGMGGFPTPSLGGMNMPSGNPFAGFGQPIGGVVGGFLDRLDRGLSDNSNTLLALGGGMISGGLGKGLSDAARVGLVEGEQVQKQKTLRQAQQSAYASVKAAGGNEAQAMAAASNPEILKMMMARIYPELKFEKAEQQYGSFNPTTGKFEIQGTAPKLEKLGAGDTLQAVTAPGGGHGASAVQVATGGPDKPPEGYQWKDKNDPSKGLQAIGGGPATKLPANEAGYLAMMESSRPGVESAKNYFLGPDFKTGALDAAGKAIGQATNSFEISRHRRSISLATEAALRIATGAAAPDTEVARYANFYMPSVYDSKETREQKLNALTRFMDYAKTNIGAGRMPPPEAFMPPSAGGGVTWERGPDGKPRPVIK